MSDKINIAALRFLSVSAPSRAHGVAVTSRDLLALVEAVEAAHAHVVARRDRLPSEWPRLLDALARFDFADGGR